MYYSPTDLSLSLHRHVMDLFREDGWDILLRASGTVYSHTSDLPEARGSLTIVKEFPADPAHIVRLTDRSPQPHEVAVPAFAVVLVGAPIRISRYGIGDERFWREQPFIIAGFVEDDRQHRRFSDMLYEWLGADKYLNVWDYSADGSNPPLLDPAEVVRASVIKDERFQQMNDALRYYVAVEGALGFVD